MVGDTSAPPKHFLFYPQRVTIQHPATPAIPFLSYLYFTASVTPGYGGLN
jgi:hypothetical protein